MYKQYTFTWICLYKQIDYWPSHHPRDDKLPAQVIDEFLKVVVEGSSKARAGLKHELNIKYGESDMEHYDCFYPDDYNEGKWNCTALKF